MQIYGNKKFDSIVIGSGPGGAIVAKELSKKGRRVLILEKGNNIPINGTILQTIQMAMVPGKSFFLRNNCLPLSGVSLPAVLQFFIMQRPSTHHFKCWSLTGSMSEKKLQKQKGNFQSLF